MMIITVLLLLLTIYGGGASAAVGGMHNNQLYPEAQPPYMHAQMHMDESIASFHREFGPSIDRFISSSSSSSRKQTLKDRNMLSLAHGCARTPPIQPLPSPFPPLLERGIEQLKNVFHTMFTKANASAGVVTVVYDQQHVMTYTYGTVDHDSDSRPVDADTQFSIGSISKVFTDLMAMHLKEQGKISLLDQITRWAPEYKPRVPGGGTSKYGGTLRDLGSHLAGLPRYSPCPWANCTIGLAEVLDRISEWTLLWPSTSKLAYSNTGFSLLGRILERAAGTTWEQYVGKLVTSLNMTRTVFKPPADLTNMARAYTDGVEYPVEDLGFSTPAGGVISTANDMGEFMKFIFRDNMGVDTIPAQVLDGTTIREWVNTKLYTNPTYVPENSVLLTEWGFPWQIMQTNTNISTFGNITQFFLTSKDGSVPGYESQLVLQTDLKVGVFTSMTMNTTSFGPFFSDAIVNTGFGVVPVMQTVLASLPWTIPLPSDPTAYVGSFKGTPGVYALITATVSYKNGAYGHRLYLDSNIPGYEHFSLQWLGVDVFEQMDSPNESCGSIQGGNHYNIIFTRTADGGTVNGFAIQGFLPYDLSFVRSD